MKAKDEWAFEANMERGCLPTGEPLECLYGTEWWTEGQEQPDLPPVVQCHRCGGQAYDLGDKLDCENCGEFSVEEEK